MLQLTPLGWCYEGLFASQCIEYYPKFEANELILIIS